MENGKLKINEDSSVKYDWDAEINIEQTWEKLLFI